MTGLLALAFGAGLPAPVNPFGFGLLPAMLTATLGPARPGGTPHGLVPRLAGGLRAGLALTLGFTAAFTMIGVGLTLGVRSLITLVPWLAAGLGVVLALVGVAMLAGWHLPLRLPTRHPEIPGDADSRPGTARIVVFGAGYAVCLAPWPSCSRWSPRPRPPHRGPRRLNFLRHRLGHPADQPRADRHRRR